MTFSITMEMVSLLITFLLGLLHYDRQNRNNRQYHLFSICLTISFFSIALESGEERDYKKIIKYLDIWTKGVV